MLIFDVELTDFVSREQFEAAMQAQQNAMQQGGGDAGGPPPQ
jgi:hypothetical protein